LLIILILLTVYKKQENAGNIASVSVAQTSPSYNTEAVQNIASVYAESTNSTSTFNNIRVTGNNDGKLTSPNGNYKLSIDDNGKLHVTDTTNKELNITPATDLRVN